MPGLERNPFDSTPGTSCPRSPRDHGHAPAILRQIRHALGRLLATGEETRINLTAMPFGPGDLDRLTQILGQGEIHATVDALGETLVQETAIPGVWLVDYRGTENQRLTLQIEIASVPEILRPHPETLAEAIDTLDSRMPDPNLGPSNSPQSS